MSENEIRVILADDHIVVREGLRGLIDSAPDIRVIASVDDGGALMDALEIATVDVVVMDLQMPVISGLAALKLIREQKPGVRVLVLTAFSDPESLQRAIELGADGFALKTESPKQVIEAIRLVASGRLVFPRAAQRLLGRRSEPDAGPSTILSQREIEVLDFVAQGFTNGQIAEDLMISQNTVRFHLKNIFEKLGVTNRTEAAAWYFQYFSSGPFH